MYPGSTYSLQSSNSVAVSFIVLAFFVVFVIFSREILSTIILTSRSIFKLRNQYRNEEKLSFVFQRDITAIISAALYPLLLTLFFDSELLPLLPVNKLQLLLLSLGVVVVIWFARMCGYRFLSWITRDRTTFRLVEKISYNHIIISLFFTLPAMLITLLWPDIEIGTRLKVLVCCYLFVYLLFLLRSYQIIISNHYSRFFIILYLCTLELLPTALIANVILSH